MRIGQEVEKVLQRSIRRAALTHLGGSAVMAVEDAALREKMAKLEALFRRAGTDGERLAAEAAYERLKAKADATFKPAPPVEIQFTLNDPWSRRLFIALCRKHGIKPYRYPRQRRTTVVVRAPRAMLDTVLLPEFSRLQLELTHYFNETVDHLIATAMQSDGNDDVPEQGQLL
jgi:hypothetical protein